MPPIDHIARFFTKHAPGFAYNSKKPISEFYRFSDTVGWEKKPRGGSARDAAYQDFLRALTLQFNAGRSIKDPSIYAEPYHLDYHAMRMKQIRRFNASFGMKLNNLKSWQSLASCVGIEPVPTTLKECQQRIKGSHINLVDLVEAFPQGRRIKRFPSEEALSVYTDETQKFFPRRDIREIELFNRFFRRNILEPKLPDRADSGEEGDEKTAKEGMSERET